MPTTEDLIDQLVAEYADRVARDEDPAPEELIARQPGLADELRQCFAMIDAGRQRSLARQLPAEGLRLGPFRLVREIGRGGMGVVYEAEQQTLKRPVALKVLRHHLTLESRHVDRFRREAEAAARLRHPNVVTVHEVGEQDGHHFIAMDLVKGSTLSAIVGRLVEMERRPTADDLARLSGRTDLARCSSYSEAVVRLLLPALEGVQAAHAIGLVHRDLKPSNILVDSGGVPHVADFGLAKGEGDLGLSITGEPIGTPYYMSPEQAQASRRVVDASTDVYSLGVVLYELLTLHVPFEGRTAHEVITHILHQPPQRPRSLAPDVPPALEAVVLKALSKDPDQRYLNAAELARDLQAVLDGRSIRARRTSALGEFLRASGLALLGTPKPVEFRSARTWLGWPLVHVAGGMEPGTNRWRCARGWLAIGPAAIGGLAVGGLAIGLLGFGGLGIGLLGAFGGFAVGGLALGGMALGGVTLGGFSAGALALGGQAYGYLAAGGKAVGTLVLDHHSGRMDPRALEILQEWMPWALDLLRFGG
jgi:serine/threonine protein kinase